MTLPDRARARGRSRTARGVRRVLTALPRAVTGLRRSSPRQGRSLVGLVALSLLLAVGTLVLGSEVVPPSAQVLPLLGGGLLLGRRPLLRLLLVVAAALVLSYARVSAADPPAGATVVVALTALFAWEAARSRDETGLGGLRGDTVLVELRKRLEQQGQVPHLPPGWHAEVVVRPAGEGPFSGDFVVSSLGRGGRLAGGRARGRLRQGRRRGDPRAAAVRGARRAARRGTAAASCPPRTPTCCGRTGTRGSPPRCTSSWTCAPGATPSTRPVTRPSRTSTPAPGGGALHEADGVVLGLLPEVAYVASRGCLDPGDALLLYTDGLVEIPGRDLSVGIDKLLGEAERLVPQGFRGGADALVSRVAGASPDDRGLVLLWRDG